MATFRRGDTVSQIAAKLGISVKKFLALNPQIKNPNLIYAGAKYNVPAVKKTAAPAKKAAAPPPAAPKPPAPASPALPAPGTAPPGSGVGGTPDLPSDPRDTGNKGLTAEQKSAKAMITGELAKYGLASLGAWAWNTFLGGAPVEQIMLDMRDRDEYKQRFKGLSEMRAKGRGITESEWINYEQQAASLMRAHGLPEGFYDGPEDFAKFITGEVSMKELDDRLGMAQQAAFSAPQEVRDQLARLYNVGVGELTAFWIDPDKALPLLERKFTAAQLAAESAKTGFGSLSLSQAERIASFGVDPSQAGATFKGLAGMSELTQEMAGEEDDIDQDTLLQAGFGNDYAATQRLERRAKRRVGEFQGGGGYAAGQTGVTGLGSANR